MHTMSIVGYCLAGFGGLVVVAAIGLAVYLLCDSTSSKKNDSDK